MWSCSLGRRSHRDRLTPRLVGIKGPGSVVSTPARGRLLSPRYFAPRSLRYRETRSHAQRSVVLIRDDLERMRRAQQARRELEKHQRRLADEVDRAVTQTRPSPWLKPWDPGYESATAIALRQAAEASSGRRCHGDLRRMESRMDAIRRQTHPSWGVPARKPCWADCRQEETPDTGRIFSREDS
jgi:hypothetical protein